MSYIEKNLLPDEQIAFRTKKHLIIFLMPMVWTAITVFFFLNTNPIIAKLAIAPAVVALFSWASQWLNYVTSAFVVTNKRVMLKEGFFFRHANEMRLTTITNVAINQSLLAQMLNYGTVVISGFGGTDDVFTQIDQPFEFQ